MALRKAKWNHEGVSPSRRPARPVAVQVHRIELLQRCKGPEQGVNKGPNAPPAKYSKVEIAVCYQPGFLSLLPSSFNRVPVQLKAISDTIGEVTGFSSTRSRSSRTRTESGFAGVFRAGVFSELFRSFPCR